MPGTEADTDGLEAYFAAARREAPPAPATALLNRILADAAEACPPPAPAPRPLERPGLSDRLRALFTPVGAWRGAAALGLCAAIGLSAGLLGGADLGDGALWTNVAAAEVADDDAAAEILAFYDLASPEG
jgi:hypothetical protein